LTAGSKDPDGSVLYLGNIDVSGGGVIGANVTLTATGNIKGAIVARNSLNISALQNIAVTAFAGGEASVNAGGDVSGTLIGLDALNVTGGTIEAALLSQDITTSGNVTSAQIGFAPVTVANAAGQSESADSVSKSGAAFEDSNSDDDERRHGKGAKPRLQSSGRVTVLPPEK
jgi:predicted acyltransferase (DUF342 family)